MDNLRSPRWEEPCGGLRSAQQPVREDLDEHDHDDHRRGQNADHDDDLERLLGFLVHDGGLRGDRAGGIEESPSAMPCVGLEPTTR